ncbi:phosphomannomutase/phosphoglucomutase [Arsenicicoccus piscis]|uniref:Phosphomannomutase/phosphoglucomutase n=1 Tax=Arsenicicoccus piscis TaxID=673954 RepID=A0ABQ6HJ43_9MICO|nr:phosphomannomutase/phosphoglucomutase [Arsenicicoccus piscis]MCH8628281.1 phosphomannomutase/phosphoglucomutase [Arsenicicoccus piscis]GMA18536.1 phosphomannomutase/phosphoglucomutase [Arsenicicoccus piscis]
MPEPIDLATFVKAYDVRGLVPDQLNPQVARALGSAFATVVVVPEGAREVVVGEDMRPSSPELARAFADGVAEHGVDVRLIGLCSTDGLYYASGVRDVPGAMFTASHNPATYNGIKLCRAGARPIGQDTGLDEIRRRAQALLDGGLDSGLDGGEDNEPDGSTGTIVAADELGGYAEHLRTLVDLTAPQRRAPLRVVVDAGNGMAGLTVPAVLQDAAGLAALPLEVIPLYFELDGTFPNHEANPLEPANLVDLQAAVREHGADLGLAFDGDADRCFVVDEQGRAVSPSAITGLVTTREIARARASGADPGRLAVVYNVISSRAVPEVIAEAGARGVRTRVGHSFIKAEMAEHDALFGGEHSAHYYFRDFWFADTGMLAALHVLAALGEQEGPLSELVAEFDRYVASGELNTRVASQADTLARVRAFAEQRGLAIDELDGLTATHEPGDDGPLWWFNVRGSNTEPLLRLNVEAADAATMTRVRDELLALIQEGAA